MKKLFYGLGVLLIAASSLFLVGCGKKCEQLDQTECKGRNECRWNQQKGKCELGSGPLSVTVLSFGSIDGRATHQIKKIAGLTASNDGEFVYVVGTAVKSMAVLKVDPPKWSTNVADGFQFWPASDHAATMPGRSTLSAAVEKTVPSVDGILLGFATDLVVLKGTGEGNLSSRYGLGGGSGDISDSIGAFRQVTKGGIQFIYVAGPSAAGNIISFRPYKAPPVDDSGLWGVAVTGLTKNVQSMAQDGQGNLWAADVDYMNKMNEADVGEEGKSLAPVFPLDQFSVGNGVSAMAAVGNILLVGFASANASSGGLVFGDVNMPASTWTRFGQGLTVTNIAVGTTDKQHALITTNKGLFVFEKSRLLEVIDNKPLIDGALVKAYPGKLASKEDSLSGFQGNLPRSGNDMRGAGQAKDGTWYIGSVGGVFTLKIEQKTFN